MIVSLSEGPYDTAVGQFSLEGGLGYATLEARPQQEKSFGAYTGGFPC